MLKLNRLVNKQISTYLFSFTVLTFSPRKTKLIVPLSVPQNTAKCSSVNIKQRCIETWQGKTSSIRRKSLLCNRVQYNFHMDSPGRKPGLPCPEKMLSGLWQMETLKTCSRFSNYGMCRGRLSFKCRLAHWFLITDLLTYFMEQSPSCEADRFSASQKIPPHFMELVSTLPHSQAQLLI